MPSQGFLEDCSSNVAYLAHLRTAPLTPIHVGDTVTVRLHFTPWAGPMSWFGFWMDTRIVIARRHHVVQSWTGRMYLPPWAADPTSVETVVEAMGVEPATAVLVAGVLALLVGGIVDFRLYVMVHAVPQDFLR